MKFLNSTLVLAILFAGIGCRRTSSPSELPWQRTPVQSSDSTPAPTPTPAPIEQVAETPQPEPESAEETPELAVEEFMPTAGMPRAAVEAAYGPPHHTARMKDGRDYALYNATPRRFRSIIYDEAGNVSSMYPSGSLESPPEKEAADPAEKTEPFNPGQPRGALTGASIFLSPGHGWFLSSGGTWSTQRGVSHGIIEDFSNAEAVLQYLVPYLWNAGARVYTTRERSLNPNMVIVDDVDPGFSATGSWTSDYVPGAYNGRHLRVQTTDDATSATAVYTPEIPEEGRYGVYVWYRPADRNIHGSGENHLRTTTQARIRINHSGGSSYWYQDQNRDGHTWKYIGDFHFEKGANAESGSVTIENLSDDPNSWLIADAVRFGGGMGDTLVDGKKSGGARWEESGMFHARFMGYDPGNDTRTYNSVSAMPMWAEWEMEEWEKDKSLYLAWHSNASGSGGNARGIVTLVYGPEAWVPLSDSSFTGYPGGSELGTIVHDVIVGDVQSKLEPQWRDAGKVTRWLGEVNPRNNNRMPAALVEYGFHDNSEDAELILDPQFRDAASRATYKGIVKYFAEQVPGFTNTTLIPARPKHLTVTGKGEEVVVSWRAPEANVDAGAATAYKVFYSRNGKGFDNGTTTTRTSFVAKGLERGRPHFFKVTAVNAGGESFATETLAAALPAGGDKPVLLVNGFTRLDRELNLTQPNNARRGILEKMNTFDYSIQHGEAIAAAGRAFDSISRDGFTTETLTAKNYPAVVWIMGQQKGEQGTFGEAQQGLVAEYLRNGGALLVSGSEIASDLKDKSPDFLRDQLRAKFVDSSSQSWTVRSVEDGIFAGIGRFTIAQDANGIYPVQAPDVLAPGDGAAVALEYDKENEAAGVAAIAAATPHRIVYLAVPLEAVNEEEARLGIMERALRFLIQE